MSFLKTIFIAQSFKAFLQNEDVEALTSQSFDPNDGKHIRSLIKSEQALKALQKMSFWRERAYADLKRSEDLGINWTWPGQPDYPLSWMSLTERPPVMCYRGDPIWTSLPTLSVVGSRSPHQDTLLWLQRELMGYLRETPLVIVSGGARGVDQWAHRIAMDARSRTICVFPSGLLNPYPPGQGDFWERIIQTGGALISTFGLTNPIRRHYFPIRNRWIVGLSEMTLVAEANLRSGSMLTAKLTLEEGRALATLPVSPYCIQGQGNLQLLKTGLVELLRDRHDLKSWTKQVLS